MVDLNCGFDLGGGWTDDNRIVDVDDLHQYGRGGHLLLEFGMERPSIWVYEQRRGLSGDTVLDRRSTGCIPNPQHDALRTKCRTNANRCGVGNGTLQRLHFDGALFTL